MSVEYDGLTFERLGHASVRIETDDGTVVYIDPWSDVLDGEPADGDVVFVTHDDFDHYDPEAIQAVAAPGATVAAYEAVDTSDIAFDTVDLPHEGKTTVGGIDVESIPAYNDPEGDHVDEDGNPFHAEGEVIGLRLTIGGTTVYFPSDTDFLPRQESVTAEVFVPPIGGHYTMNRQQAVEFARSVDPDLVLPVHYDTFEPIQTDADAFAEELRADEYASSCSDEADRHQLSRRESHRTADLSSRRTVIPSPTSRQQCSSPTDGPVFERDRRRRSAATDAPRL